MAIVFKSSMCQLLAWKAWKNIKDRHKSESPFHKDSNAAAEVVAVYMNMYGVAHDLAPIIWSFVILFRIES